MDISFQQIANNLNSVTINGVRVWFSYETAVAFSYAGNMVVHENIWSVTTAKHLTKIDGGSKEAMAARVDSQTFDTMMTLAMVTGLANN